MKRWLGALLQLPLSFEAAPDPGAFLARGAGAEIELRCAALDVAWPGGPERVRIAFAGARPEARLAPSGPAAAHASYLIGRDPAEWRRKVPRYARLTCAELRPGVDLVFHGSGDQLEFDLALGDAAALAGVQLEVTGAETQTLTPDGDLALRAGAHELRLRHPVSYQDIAGERRAVESRFVQGESGRFGFALGAHAPQQPLVVDPVLELSSYAGGKRFDSVRAVAVDDAGFVVVAGSSDSNDFPTTAGAFQPEYAGSNDDFDRGDAFVMLLAPGAASVVWATYFGGRDADEATGVALAPGGDIVLVGSSWSKDLPITPGAFQPERGKDVFDAYVARLTPAGDDLVYATYLGGKDADRALDVAVDAAGAATLVGYTYSNDFPVTPGAFQTRRNGTQDAFVSRLAADGGSLLWSSYLGGKNSSAAYGVALAPGGGAVVVGGTLSSKFPTSEGAFQPEYANDGDAFVTRFASNGAALRWSTFLGGNRDKFFAFDLAHDVALDAGENVYVVGETLSKNFPVTLDAFDTSCGKNGACSARDAFAAKLSPDGCSLLYGSYLGEDDSDSARGVAVDERGHAHVTGFTRDNQFPLTPDAFQSDKGGGADAFLSEFGAGGARLVYSSYLGGNNDDVGNAVALGGALRVHLGGSAGGNDFPLAGTAFQTEYQGSTDGFVSVFSAVPAIEPALVASLVTVPNPAVVDSPVTTALTVRNAGSAAAAGVSASLDLSPALAFGSATPSQGSCSFAAPVLSCALGALAPSAEASVTVVVTPVASGFLAQSAELSAAGADTVRAAACVSADAHDLTISALKAPKSLRLASGSPATTEVSVEVQNRSSHAERIEDLGTLTALVALAVTPTGAGCPAAAVALDPGSAKKLPLELAPKKKLKLNFTVTISCALTDYRCEASVDHGALDGLPDSHPGDDVCPRGPGGVDPNPDGSISDKGCGAKGPDGSLGADVVIDVVSD